MKHNLKTILKRLHQTEKEIKIVKDELRQLKQIWTKKVGKGEHYELALYFLDKILGENQHG